jgi:hypothetical protein
MLKVRDPISGQVEWIRPSQMPVIFGISRSVAYELLSAGKIRSIVLRKRGGDGRGCRLINADSVRRFFANLAAEQETGK